MTDSDLELFDDAKQEFPAKEDLKDRLVAIWALSHGTRPSTQPGAKPYPWVETITLVLDDGPAGDAATELVPAAPQVLDVIQYSTKGLTSRLIPRANAKNTKPLLGRINSMKNKIKSYSDAWSIAEPTDEDKATAVKYAAELRRITAIVDERLNGTSDDEAFDA